MDIKKIFTKIMSPETYTEKAVFIGLGVYCVVSALLTFVNAYYMLSRSDYLDFRIFDYLLVLFSIAIGFVVLAKFCMKIKGEPLKQGLLGLGLWLIFARLYIFIPSAVRLYSFFTLVFSIGVGIVIMIGVIRSGSVKKETGLFLFGFYLFTTVSFLMFSIIESRSDSLYASYFVIRALLLFVAGVLLIFRRSDESIVGDDVLEDISSIK